MSEQNENLSPRQHRAILALLECASVEKAALDCKVSSKTLRRWLREASFREAYLQAGERLFEEGLGQLQRLTSFAVAKLAQALVNGSVGQTLRAAEIIFTHGRPAINMRLDAMLRLEGSCGVLLTSEPVNAETWKAQAEELVEYQQWLISQGPPHGGESAKPQAEKTNTA